MLVIADSTPDLLDWFPAGRRSHSLALHALEKVQGNWLRTSLKYYPRLWISLPGKNVFDNGIDSLLFFRPRASVLSLALSIVSNFCFYVDRSLFALSYLRLTRTMLNRTLVLYRTMHLRDSCRISLVGLILDLSKPLPVLLSPVLHLYANRIACNRTGLTCSLSTIESVGAVIIRPRVAIDSSTGLGP